MIDKTQPLVSATSQPAPCGAPAGEAASALPQPRPTAPLGVERAARERIKPPEPLARAAHRNIHLRFKIDPQTNDVTVLMIDAATRRVIRTIPPDQLRQLAEGELVELLA